MKYILAIDQGTTSSRAVVYDENLKVVGLGQKTFPQHFPKADWVEHDLEELWSSVTTAIDLALNSVKSPQFSASRIAAIGITNQRESFGLWERDTGTPTGRAIVWQCKRSADICEKLKKSAIAKQIVNKTGLVIDPYFSGSKLKWLFENVKGLKTRARSGSLAFGTIDTFLIWRLSGGRSHVTDVSNASRTMLMDIQTLQWSPFLLKALDVPEAILPKILDSDALFGHTQDMENLPDGIPIHGVLGDQQAALFGQGCFSAGESKLSYGTGAFLLLNTGEKLKRTKSGVSTVAWTVKGNTSYALEGSVFIAGAAVQWLRDGLKMISKSSEIESLASSVEDSDGVFFVPALSGLGSPYWAPHAKGLIGGLTRRSSQGHLARACLEGIAYSIADLVSGLIEDAGIRLKKLKVDGGASMNEILLQAQADLLQVKIERPLDIESTARGAASMAAVGVGILTLGKELAEKNTPAHTVSPKIKAGDSRQRIETWRRRVKALLAGAF